MENPAKLYVCEVTVKYICAFENKHIVAIIQVVKHNKIYTTVKTQSFKKQKEPQQQRCNKSFKLSPSHADWRGFDKR